MKNILSILLLLVSCHMYASNDTVADKYNFRTKTLQQAFPLDSISSSSLLTAFEGLGIKPIQEAYALTRLKVDSLIEADSLSTNIFVNYGLQGIYIFKESKNSQQKAMSLLAPLFAALMLLILVPYGINTFIVGPKLEQAMKPENDPDEKNEDDEEGEEDFESEEAEMEALGEIFKNMEKD
jgi:hypothetical protein